MSLLTRLGKFHRDMLWNLMAFGAMGICGVLLNVAIGRFYGPDVLGVFNLVYALYIFLSQLAVLGIWFSVLKHTADYADDAATRSAAISSGLTLTAVAAAAFTLLTWGGAKVLAPYVTNQAVVSGFITVLPGFFCYCCNKSLLAVLNGMRDMKGYALAQTGRYLLIIATLGGFVAFGLPGSYVPLCISLPEIVLTLAVLPRVLSTFKPVPPSRFGDWTRRHLAFGLKSCPSGILGELNTRVDLFVLGLFANTYEVGLYSMAAMVAEGFMQLSVVLRDNLNPLVSGLVFRRDLAGLGLLLRRNIRLAYAVMAALGLAAMAAYPLFIKLLVHDPRFLAGLTPFCILVGGVILAAGYLPLSMLLVQAGFPGLHSWLKLLVVASNLGLNLALTPRLGMVGAALAMAGTNVLSVVFLKALAWRALRFRI